MGEQPGKSGKVGEYLLSARERKRIYARTLHCGRMLGKLPAMILLLILMCTVG